MPKQHLVRLLTRAALAAVPVVIPAIAAGRILPGAAGAAEDQRREGVKGSVRGLPLGVPKT
jgi:hypothetical protein